MLVMRCFVEGRSREVWQGAFNLAVGHGDDNTASINSSAELHERLRKNLRGVDDGALLKVGLQQPLHKACDDWGTRLQDVVGGVLHRRGNQLTRALRSRDNKIVIWSE